MVPRCEYGSSFLQKTECHCIWPHLAPIYDDTDKRAVCLSQNSDQEITGEMEDVEVVRTFYTSRLPPKKDLDVWYADKEFGFYESLPKRVADLGATHINIEVRNPNSSEPVSKISDSCFFFPTCLVS